MIKPGSSALFVLDQKPEGEIESILHRIQGFGGTILKTTVDLARAKQIQMALTGTTANHEELPRREINPDS